MIWRSLQNLQISLTGSPPNFHWSARLRPDHYSMAETVDGTYLSVTKTSRSNAGPLTGKPARPASLSLDGPDGLPQVSAPSTGLEFHPLPSSVVNQQYMWAERVCVHCTVQDDLHGNILVKLWEKFPGLSWHQLWFWIAGFIKRKPNCDLALHAVSFLQCQWSNCAETSENSATMNPGRAYLALICMVVRKICKMNGVMAKCCHDFLVLYGAWAVIYNEDTR